MQWSTLDKNTPSSLMLWVRQFLNRCLPWIVKAPSPFDVALRDFINRKEQMIQGELVLRNEQQDEQQLYDFGLLDDDDFKKQTPSPFLSYKQLMSLFQLFDKHPKADKQQADLISRLGLSRVQINYIKSPLERDYSGEMTEETSETKSATPPREYLIAVSKQLYPEAERPSPSLIQRIKQILLGKSESMMNLLSRTSSRLTLSELAKKEQKLNLDYKNMENVKVLLEDKSLSPEDKEQHFCQAIHFTQSFITQSLMLREPAFGGNDDTHNLWFRFTHSPSTTQATPEQQLATIRDSYDKNTLCFSGKEDVISQIKENKETLEILSKLHEKQRENSQSLSSFRRN